MPIEVTTSEGGDRKVVRPKKMTEEGVVDWAMVGLQGLHVAKEEGAKRGARGVGEDCGQRSARRADSKVSEREGERREGC